MEGGVGEERDVGIGDRDGLGVEGEEEGMLEEW